MTKRAKTALCIFGQAAVNAIYLWILKLFEDVNMDCSFPMRCYMLRLDAWFKHYEVFKISAKLRATANAAKSAQNSPKLPKFAKICPKTKL
jgi:hypothetical protein